MSHNMSVGAGMGEDDGFLLLIGVLEFSEGDLVMRVSCMRVGEVNLVCASLRGGLVGDLSLIYTNRHR